MTYNYYKPKYFQRLLRISNEFSRFVNGNPEELPDFDKVQFEKDERKYLRLNANNPNYRYFLCEQNGDLAAYIWFGKADRNREIGFIGELYVRPAFRNQGIATALMEEALIWIAKQHCDCAELSVRTKDKAAISLYRKFGFMEQIPTMLAFKKLITGT